MALVSSILPDISETKEYLTARWKGEQIVSFWHVTRPLAGDPAGWLYKFFRMFYEIPITAHMGVLVLLVNGTYHLIERDKGRGRPTTVVNATLAPETSQAIINGKIWDALDSETKIQDGPMIHEAKRFRDEYITTNKYHWLNENCQKFAPLSSRALLEQARSNTNRRVFRWMAVKYGVLSVPLVPCVFYFLWRRRRVDLASRLRMIESRSILAMSMGLRRRS
ncbi:hypothetical protein TWF481_001401 [Arthrobotrys musiformis]|uniref:PPPDE domain-containing protein n=1 Tax=Arthrobotrys musiformis TaxID=47236 RepID=A0AAV9WSK3_9PEZI